MHKKALNNLRARVDAVLQAAKPPKPVDPFVTKVGFDCVIVEGQLTLPALKALFLGMDDFWFNPYDYSFVSDTHRLQFFLHGVKLDKKTNKYRTFYMEVFAL